MRLLFTLLLLLISPAALADEPLTDLMLTQHDVGGATGIAEATVAFRVGDKAVFASPSATYEVTLKKGRPKIRTRDGHPQQDHHLSSAAFPFAGGAVVILADDRKRLSLVRYDGAKGTWTALERPVGFVPRGAAVAGRFLVFPQSSRSTTWFVFDPKTDSFAAVERPESVDACAGAVFGDGRDVVVAGEDQSGELCAITFDPDAKKWGALAAPPTTPGDRVVQSGSVTYLIGEKGTLRFEAGKWTTMAGVPHSPGHHVGASDKQLWGWRLRGAKVTQWVSGAAGTAEPMNLVATSVVGVSASRWIMVARQEGRPVLVDVEYDPGASPEERAANRGSFRPSASHTERDWKDASETEQRAALERGLGAVERYVPPELDEKGKVKTKGAWVFALGEQLVVWPAPPKTCRRFIEKILRKWPSTTVGTTWKTERGAGFARSGKTMLYSPAGQCQAAQKCAADYYSQRAVPLSQVGPIFSYSEHISSVVDCGEPTSIERWHAIDLRTNRPAELTAVIDGESALAALKKHKTLGGRFADAETLDEALAILKADDPLGLNGYAFGGWRSTTRRVELRLEFHPKSTDMVVPVKLWVKPIDEFVPVFEAAAKTRGMFMGSSE